MRVLITGSAGFIGFHLASRLLGEGHDVFGLDGMTPYYNVALKQARIAILQQSIRYTHSDAMLEERDRVLAFAQKSQPDVIVHLAAQAGVRYSLEHPEAYVSANLVGTFNVMEAARLQGPQHLLMASTSSVYGGNEKMPFREVDRCDAPITLYAATKKSNEAMSHSYAHLWNIPTTCFRFFTVYGPWGRPDMALYKFADAIERDEPINVYGEGKMKRDFTYIDDLVEGIVRLMAVPPIEDTPHQQLQDIDSLSPVAPWRAVNIAGGQPVGLMALIEAIEEHMGKSAKKNFMPMQMGDVRETWASADLLQGLTEFRPQIPVKEGVGRFIDWYRQIGSQY